MVREWGLSVCSGLSWLRAQKYDRLSRTWQRTFVLRELYNIPWQKEGPSSFGEGTCSTEQSYRGWSISTQISGGARFGYPSRHVTSRHVTSRHATFPCLSLVSTYKYNVSVNNPTLYLIYDKNSILSGRHVSAFIRPSSGPLGKQIQELSIFQRIVESQDPKILWQHVLQ